MATPLGYCIQFHPYAGRGLNEYMEVGLGKSFITQISERKRNMWNGYSKGMEDEPTKFTVDVDKNQRGTYDVVVGKLFITLIFL